MNIKHKLLKVLASGGADTTAPTCTITSTASGIVTGTFTCTFTFSEAVTGFDNTKITVTNGSAGAVAGTGPYTSVITPTATGAVTVQVEASKVTDLAGNNNIASNLFNIVYVLSIVFADLKNITYLFQDSTLTTPVTLDSDPVGGVTDRSGNSNTLTGATTTRPLYKTTAPDGIAGVLWDDVDDKLTFPTITLSGDFSIYIICSHKQDRAMLGVSTAESTYIQPGSASNVNVDVRLNGNFYTFTVVTFSSGAIKCFNVNRSGTTLTAYENNVASTSNPLTSSDTAHVNQLGMRGANITRMGGYERLLLICTQSHNDSQRTAIYNALASLYLP